MNSESLAILESISPDKSTKKHRLTKEEALVLLSEANLIDLAIMAHKVRLYRHPADSPVTFVIDRNINYTNICNVNCKFCAFAHSIHDKKNTYVLDYTAIKQKIQELVNQNGTQVLIQGGHHPELPLGYYTEMFSSIKRDFPQVCIHSLSPGEIHHIAKISNLSLLETIEILKASGLNSLPGAGAEILVDRVREIISPQKISSQEWLDIMELAHQNGLGGSATMMFGHIETLAERIEHLQKLRDLQDKTGGFRAFICWTFQPDNTALARDEQNAKNYKTNNNGDSLDYLRTLAVSRLFLDNFENIQASWVTQGFAVGQMALYAGANDFGGTMLEENVVSAAGNTTSKSNAFELIYQIKQAGYEASQRDTYYNLL